MATIEWKLQQKDWRLLMTSHGDAH
jgi:hypothetical protein